MNRSRPRNRSRQPSELKLDCFGFTDRGRARAENQDAFLVAADEGLLIVSDGMGGGNAGALASKIVVTVLPALVRESRIESLGGAAARDRIKAALVRLNADVRARTAGVPGLEGMGATVVLALVRGNRALIAHMGDSRAYRHRKGSLELLTKDHSVARVLVEHGEITRSGARTHPARDQLTRFIGMDGEALPEVRSIELRAGDRLLLCSDGLTKMVPDVELSNILGSVRSLPEVCKGLVTAANQNGGYDNVTALCAAAE